MTSFNYKPLRWGHLAWLGLGLLLVTGCATRERLDVTYGKTGGTPGGKSVNGVAVLASMFKEAGHSVTTTNRFSPRLDRAETIVWAPNDFEPPSDKHREYLEQWLREGYERTVIYIGRDYDAGSAYWRKTAPLAPPEQAAEYQRNLAKAMTGFNSERMGLPAQDEFARWFQMKVGSPRRTVTTLDGPWANGIDAKKCEIELATKFALPTTADIPTGDYAALPDFEVLLAGDGDPLAIRVTDDSWNDGQIIVVPNGSYLLNLPLVNKEHRKLAARLIAECPADSAVVFVESEAGGPPIRYKEERQKPQTGFEMLVVWPLGGILLHLLACLFVVCICLYPIFGRPRKLKAIKVLGEKSGEEAAGNIASGDFGKHLTALGELLSLTRDLRFARDKIDYYQKHVKRESGVSHIGPPATTKPAPPPQATSNP